MAKLHHKGIAHGRTCVRKAPADPTQRSAGRAMLFNRKKLETAPESESESENESAGKSANKKTPLLPRPLLYSCRSSDPANYRSEIRFHFHITTGRGSAEWPYGFT